MRGTVPVAQKSGKTEVRDSLRDEVVIQLLRIVNIVASSGSRPYGNARSTGSDRGIQHNVAIHNLRVIDVIQDFHPRRGHALHHVNPEAMWSNM